MFIGIASALLAGTMLGLYALPGKYTKDFQEENKWSLFLKNVAEVSDATTGRKLEVMTTEPGTLLYTGRYTSDELKRESGAQFGQFRAFCIETSKYPNGPNIKGAPNSVLQPGEKYNETTIYRLSWA